MSKPRKLLVLKVNNLRPEKIARDVVRLEIAALLALARHGKSGFAADILERASPEQKTWIRDELKKIEDMLRIKVNCEDDA